MKKSKIEPENTPTKPIIDETVVNCKPEQLCKHCKQSNLYWQLVPDPNGNEKSKASFAGISFNLRKLVDLMANLLYLPIESLTNPGDKPLHSAIRHWEKLILRVHRKELRTFRLKKSRKYK